MKQLCSHKVRDFAMAFRVRKLFGTFGKRASGRQCTHVVGDSGLEIVGLFYTVSTSHGTECACFSDTGRV